MVPMGLVNCPRFADSVAWYAVIVAECVGILGGCPQVKFGRCGQTETARRDRVGINGRFLMGNRRGLGGQVQGGDDLIIGQARAVVQGFDLVGAFAVEQAHAAPVIWRKR